MRKASFIKFTKNYDAMTLISDTRDTITPATATDSASSMNQTRNFADVEEDEDELEVNELVLEDC